MTLRRFQPTAEQDRVRAQRLRVLTARLPRIRSISYTGAIWAGTLIPRQLIDPDQQRDHDLHMLADKIHRRGRVEYYGSYTELLKDLETTVEEAV